MNWNKGLHRLFFVLCVLWLLYCVLWYPMQLVNAQVDGAKLLYHQELELGGTIDSAQKNFQKQLEEATLPKVWWALLTDGTWLIPLALFFPMLLLYVTVRGTIKVFMWLKNGFAS